MNIKATEGAASAPVESDAVSAPETVEHESEKAEDDEAKDTKKDADGGEPDGAPEKPSADESDSDEEDSEEKAETETKQQRKRRLRREREDANQRALADAERELSQIKKRLSKYEDVDPNKAEDYDSAAAQNAVNRALRTQEQARLEDVEAERARIAERAKADRAEAWREKVAELTHIKDFNEKVHADTTLPFTPPLVELIADMDRGPEVAYYLATHKDELQRLAEMQPTRAAIELGKIEAGLSTLKPKLKSSAPPPLKPVRGSGAEGEPDLAKMDFNSYRKARLGF